MTSKNLDNVGDDNVIDLTLSSSESETESEIETNSVGSDEDECPFNPPLNISGNILSIRHYRILNSVSSWFTDDIINGFFCKLKDSSSGLYVFSSFFYDALIHKGQAYCLKYWITARFKDFLSSLDSVVEDKLVLFPVNSGGSHWVVVAWEVSKGELSYYDSLMCKRSGNLIMKHISELINNFIDEYELDKSLSSLSLEDSSEKSALLPKIKTFSIPKGQPQQTDGSSCGPFCCFFAKHLVEKKNISGISVDIYEFRKGLIDFFINKQAELAEQSE